MPERNSRPSGAPRETQRFLCMLEAIDATTVETEEVQRHRQGLPGDPWARLLAQALEELLLEEHETSVLPIAYVRNWLGEWSREIRRKQQGLLLTSAHRAKGLEFDHVVILDGLWRKTSHSDDPDSPLRLYYVSMTRARQTLALVQLEDGDRTDIRDRPLAALQDERAARLLQPLEASASVVKRTLPKSDLSDPRLDETIADCTMEDVVLSLAGWQHPESRMHRAIDALAPGDPLSLSNENGEWKVLDDTGQQVGRMAKKWSPPKGLHIAEAEVQGIFRRTADDGNDEKFTKNLRSDTWEVVLPRFLLTPQHPTVRYRSA